MNSRPQKRLNQVWRRRKCLVCNAVFTSEESVQYASAWAVTDNSGALGPFLRDKLFLSLYRSLQHRPDVLNSATALTDTVLHKLRPSAAKGTIDAGTIAQTAQVALNRFDKVASVHYQAFHRG